MRLNQGDPSCYAALARTLNVPAIPHVLGSKCNQVHILYKYTLYMYIILYMYMNTFAHVQYDTLYMCDTLYCVDTF